MKAHQRIRGYQTRILIIDDEEGSRIGTRMCLDVEFIVDTVSCGEELFEAWKERFANPGKIPALILLDMKFYPIQLLRFPDRNDFWLRYSRKNLNSSPIQGAEILRRLRREIEYTGKVVILTAYGDVTNYSAAFAGRADNFLTKGFLAQDELREFIRGTIAGSTALPADYKKATTPASQ